MYYTILGDIELCLLNNCDISITFSPENIILGMPNYKGTTSNRNRHNFLTINFIILFGKKYIYDCRRIKKIPKIDQFILSMQQKVKIEIYKDNDNMLKEDTDAKWRNLTKFCNI